MTGHDNPTGRGDGGAAECPAPYHGVTSARWHGCTCEATRRACARYENQRQLDLLAGLPRRIDATGTKRRIRALQRLGWTRLDLARGLGVDPSAVRQLVRRDHVNRSTAARVAALYDRLSMQAPPDTDGSFRARLAAERHGYPSPLAWDDDEIDDPAARPRGQVDGNAADPIVVERILGGEWRLRANLAERVAVIGAWTAAGLSLNEIARRTGWNVRRELRRAA